VYCNLRFEVFTAMNVVIVVLTVVLPGNFIYNYKRSQEGFLGGLVVIVLAFGPKVHGLKLGRGRWTSKGDRNPQHTFL
jgi:hypothetical protein